ncbi:Csa1 family protein [uncultured Clostridium sp.]|uniref:Csa1 family protein n=1 Tax=uncultured Clostridium sp. TaxID=59620 RepID=UPI003457EF76
MPENIKNGLVKFTIMYDFIELDREYLDNLKSTRIVHNPNMPLYDAVYNLKPNDKNIAKIKQIYPDLVVDEKKCTLELNANGRPWDTIGRVYLQINLDGKSNTYLTSTMSFGTSKNVDKTIEEKN